MSTSTPHFVFAGGGTCGHLFPGLAVASRLATSLPEATITFVGSGKSQEAQHVQAAGFRYVAVPSQPLPSRPWEAVRFVSKNLSGYLAARRMLRDEEASLVIGLGGYASGASVRAALSSRIPVVLLEQNALPGRTTRWFAPSASLLCASFEQIRPHLKSAANVVITGNPVRPEFDALFHRAIDPQLATNDRPRQLLVLGGSSGAGSLNREVPRGLHKIRQKLEGWTIVHQSGAAQQEQTQTLYNKLHIDAQVIDFALDMPSLFAETDLVIGRAGGTSLAELAIAGIPAVMVPYPHATGDHQLRNARAFARYRACRIVDERDSEEPLAARIAAATADMLSDDALRGRMAKQMRLLARPSAAIDVAQAVCTMAGLDVPPIAA